MGERPNEWIFDTTVLSAFALVGRLDLLEVRYAERAHWCLEVQHEVLAGIGDHPRLGGVMGAAWLGQPIQSFAVDRIERMRQRLGGGAADDRQRGGAATIVAAIDNDWIIATDDRDATHLARAEGRSGHRASSRPAPKAGRMSCASWVFGGGSGVTVGY